MVKLLWINKHSHENVSLLDLFASFVASCARSALLVLLWKDLVRNALSILCPLVFIEQLHGCQINSTSFTVTSVLQVLVVLHHDHAWLVI